MPILRNIHDHRGCRVYGLKRSWIVLPGATVDVPAEDLARDVNAHVRSWIAQGWMESSEGAAVQNFGPVPPAKRQLPPINGTVPSASALKRMNRTDLASRFGVALGRKADMIAAILAAASVGASGGVPDPSLGARP